MGTVPPPPPLPFVNKCTSTDKSRYTEKINDSLCLWASEYLVLKQACIRNNVCKFSTPYKYSYKNIPIILQEGPTCGLVAIAMIVNNNKLKIEEIFEIAKVEGYTKYGEMFSCKDMTKLTKIILERYNKTPKEIFLRKGELCGEFIVRKLLDKCIILVPYDADYNHYPCLKGGCKAHWAVISGIIIPTEQSTPEECYVICQQGKSRHLGLWLLSDLDKSNKNLYEYNCQRQNCEQTYVFPEGGIGGENGLCDQYILIEGF